MRIKSLVTGMTQGNEVFDVGMATFPPGPNMMNMQFNIDMIIWASTANSAPILIAFQNLHAKLRSRGTLTERRGKQAERHERQVVSNLY